jgi:hypothetical protein
VLLDKTCVVVNLGRNGEEDFERWFLDNDAHDREPSGVHRPRHQRHGQRQSSVITPLSPSKVKGRSSSPTIQASTARSWTSTTSLNCAATSSASAS